MDADAHDRPEATTRWQRFKDRSRDEFQLVVRNNQTYDEVGSYNLTPLNIYVAISTVVVLVAIVVFLLIAFTPLRRYIPGYADVVERREVNELQAIIGELSEEIETRNLYIDNLSRTLNGEVITAEDIEEQSELVDTAALEPVALSEEEIRLRREMDLQRVGQRARSGGGEGSGDAPTPGSNLVTLAQLVFTTPVNGEISAGYRPTSDHWGVDVLAPKNTPIKAARPGVVFMSEYTNANGNVIGIQHDNDLVTFYKHNSRLLKQVGDRVKAGEAVAIIGNTGTQSSGPHLHFEMWHRQRPVDPTEFLRF